VNLFFGVTVNAARGVAYQVENTLRQFVYNFMTAINPQITKSYAKGDTDYVLRLVYYGAKYSYFLSLFFVLPLYFEANFVLEIWLKEVPEYAVLFTRWSLLIILVDVLSLTMLRANAASGKVRNYQIVVGGVNLMVFPISWLCFYLGMSPEVSYIVHFIIFFINIFVRIRMMRGILPVTYKDFIVNVFAKIIPVTILASALFVILSFYMEDSWIRFVIVGGLTVLVLPILIYWLGLSQNERVYAKNGIHKFYTERIKRR
jgi:Na+-driven multidrug efflux pump